MPSKFGGVPVEESGSKFGGIPVDEAKPTSATGGGSIWDTWGNLVNSSLEEGSKRVAHAFTGGGSMGSRISDVVRGTGTALAPTAIPLTLANPARAAVAGLGGVGGDIAGSTAGRIFGMSPDNTGAMQDVGAVIGAGIGSRARLPNLSRAANSLDQAILDSKNNPYPNLRFMGPNALPMPAPPKPQPPIEVGPKILPMPTPGKPPAPVEVGPKILPLPTPKAKGAAPDIEVGPKILPLPKPTAKTPEPPDLRVMEKKIIPLPRPGVPEEPALPGGTPEPVTVTPKAKAPAPIVEEPPKDKAQVQAYNRFMAVMRKMQGDQKMAITLANSIAKKQYGADDVSQLGKVELDELTAHLKKVMK